MRGEDLQTGRVRLNRAFPILRIVEAAGIALAPASIIIATLAAILLNSAGQLLDSVVGPEHSIQLRIATGSQYSLDVQTVYGAEPMVGESSYAPLSGLVQRGISGLKLLKNREIPLFSGLRFSILLIVWNLVGVILCRRSALMFVGDDDATVRSSMRFGVTHWLSSLGAPLIPLTAVVVMGAMLAAIGLVALLPWVGHAWIIALSPVIAMLGFVIAFLLLATTLGWPLMVAAVSTDNCDSFGGLSRAYSGLTGRPWQLFAYILAASLTGTALMFVVRVVANFAIQCAVFGTEIGSDQDVAQRLLFDWLRFFVRPLVTGIGVSFFWSASTIVYLLLRQDVDGVPVDRIAADTDGQTVRDPLPVVGMPATDARTDTPSDGAAR